MSIKIEITPGDYAAFLQEVNRRLKAPPEERLTRLLIAAIIGAAVGADLIITKQSDMIYWMVGATLFLFLVFADIIKRQTQRMKPATDGIMLGGQEVILEDTVFRQKHARIEAAVQWTAVRDIVVAERHIFIFLDTIAALIVPKRAFASDEECEGFVGELERRSNKKRT